jgi:hypothetical protein
MPKLKSVDELADELFRLVQKAQGQAFVSDGWSGHSTREDFLKWVRDRLDWNVQASKQIRGFLRKYKGLHN